jgi:hypothetical protein
VAADTNTDSDSCSSSLSSGVGRAEAASNGVGMDIAVATGTRAVVSSSAEVMVVPAVGHPLGGRLDSLFRRSMVGWRWGEWIADNVVYRLWQ